MTLPQLPELIDRAVHLADHIKGDLDSRWYAASDIELCIRWLHTNEIRATASVEPSLDRVRRHVISLSYGLIQELYSIALEFARFTKGRPEQQGVHLGVHMLPAQFDLLEAADLMFTAGVLFVIYHEIGHLNQNHGAIRSLYGTGTASCTIDDFEIAGEESISGAEAAISHATEFAADAEALDWMATQLEVFEDSDYLDHAYLHCAMVSCIMFLFNGDRPVQLDAEPVGTHPYPVIRMDYWVQLYAERIDLFSEQLRVTEEKSAIVKRLSDAAFVAALSWLNRGQWLNAPDYSDVCKGSLAHPNHASYMRHVINTWSRHDQIARDSRRYGGALSVLYFTDEFREMVGAVPNRESFKTHAKKTLEAMTRIGD
ncbi:hypothetical protein ACOAPY_09265 [Pseudomonas sp. P3C3]